MAITNKTEYKNRLNEFIDLGHNPFDEIVVRQMFDEVQEGNLSDGTVLEALKEMFDSPFITQRMLDELRQKYNLN